MANLHLSIINKVFDAQLYSLIYIISMVIAEDFSAEAFEYKRTFLFEEKHYRYLTNLFINFLIASITFYDIILRAYQCS
jgi:hypothetical protein